MSWHDATLGASFQMGLDEDTIRCDLLRFKVILFVTYSIIQDIISSEMKIRTGPLNGQCKKNKNTNET